VQQGVEVTVLAPGAPGAPGAETRHGVRVQRARYWIDRWQALAIGVSGIVPNLRQRPWLIVQLPLLVASLIWWAVRLARDATLIHAHWVYPGGLAGLVAARVHGIPLIVTSHGGDLNLARRSRFLRAIVRRVSRSADLCLGVSHAMVEEFVRNGAPAARVRFVPLGVEATVGTGETLDAGDPLLREFAGQPGLRAVYVGSLIPRKSVLTLLEAHAIVQADGREIATLVVGTGPTEPELRRFVRERQLRGVFFAGAQAPEAVRPWIRAGQVLVLPSRSEGRGLVLVEAMIEGIPVVATDIPGPRELVLPGQTGCLFPPGDSRALADCLERLADESLRRRLGEGGRALVEEQGLTVAASARQHVELYRALVS
jgi:glycosyltransferase involved in cell wall biosynthesis